MQNQALEAVNSAVESAYATTQELVDINANAIESLLDKQLEVVGQVLDFGVKQAKLFGESRDVKATLAAQTELYGAAAEQAMGNVRDVLKIANETRVAYDKLFKEGVQEAVAAVKPKSTKKAA